MPRKRSEVSEQAEEAKVGESPVLPIERDASAMAIELKLRGYKVPVSVVSSWEKQERHIVALFLNYDLEDVPTSIEKYKMGAEETSEQIREATTKPPPPPEENYKRQPSEGAARAALPESGRPEKGAEAKKALLDSLSERVEGELRVNSEETHDEVTVAWGPEKISVKYQTMDVGPFSSTVRLRPGESLAAARARAYDDLVKFAEDVREKRKRSFFEFLKSIAEESKALQKSLP